MRMIKSKYLFLTSDEEFIWINPVADSAPNERNPMEYNWRFIVVPEKQLVQEIENNGE